VVLTVDVASGRIMAVERLAAGISADPKSTSLIDAILPQPENLDSRHVGLCQRRGKSSDQLSTTKIRPLITPTRSRVGNGNAASIRACALGGA
jgi:hypothetical protein